MRLSNKSKLIALSAFIFFLLLFWWLLLQGSTRNAGDFFYDVEKFRQLVDAGGLDHRPTEIRCEFVGSNVAPGIAAETGNFRDQYYFSFTATQIVWPDKHMIIDGAVDYAVAQEMRTSEDEFVFNSESYQRVLKGISGADSVWLTHAHLDHVMAIAEHPDLKLLVPKLKLNSQQINLWQASSEKGLWSKLPDSVEAYDIQKPTLIAPGVVLVPNAGHTPGSQSFYIQLKNDREFFIIGDIVWVMSNIENLKTRPRLLQYMVFDPNEERRVVLSQVKALNILSKNEPKLSILPSHDTRHLTSLIESGHLKMGFLLK